MDQECRKGRRGMFTSQYETVCVLKKYRMFSLIGILTERRILKKNRIFIQYKYSIVTEW